MANDEVLLHNSECPGVALREKDPVEEHFLVISPYTAQEHRLDLRTLDTENALLALALVHMRCLRPDYATAPYLDTFNWGEIIEEKLTELLRQRGHKWKESSFFVVTFRSRIPPTTVYEELGTLDKAAQAEATASGGFLKYWFGDPDKDGRNLATCLWRSQEDAKKAGFGPAHQRAASAARSLYSHWKIDRYRLIIRDDTTVSAIMANSLKDAPFKTVQVEALVVMKIVKHCATSFPTTATGSIVGMDRDGVLEVTNTFPFPTSDLANVDGAHQNDASSLAVAAPRAKANTVYQNEMIRHLKEVNVDANNVGWYTSATMGNFVNSGFIENQHHYQRENERTVALVHDVSRSSQGSLSLRAFKLTPTFMAAYKEGKFTTESLQKSKLSFKDVLVEFPINVHNSHLLTSYLHQIPSIPTDAEVPMPTSLSDLQHDPVKMPLHPSTDTLDLSIDPFLEKTCDLLLDSIESHYTELNNHQYYQRQLAREQTKITAWQTKRKAENAGRIAAKQQPLPEDEWQRLFKLPQEPSRLEGMLNAKQVEQYSKLVDGFTANVSAKMFAVRGNLLPE
ncbi:eukaryotic translation initiation factor 3 subunit-like protein [Whalleya microplaca]|nr:eukaryotic translation initiation factor 3 subunit-like protein [Whalleya microplaca]